MNKTIIKNLYLTINIMSDKQDTPCGSEQKRSNETNEVKTRNDGVFICTESKELFPLSEWDGSKGKAIGVAIIEGEKKLLVALKGSDKDLVLLDEGKDSGLEPYPTVSKARKDTDGRKNTEALLKAGSEAAKFCKEWGEEWHIPYMTDGIGLAHASLITIFLFSTGAMVSGTTAIRSTIIGCVLFPAF